MRKSGEPATEAQYWVTIPIFETMWVPVFELAMATIQIRLEDQLGQNGAFRTSDEEV
jgi:hypothetical protein